MGRRALPAFVLAVMMIGPAEAGPYEYVDRRQALRVADIVTRYAEYVRGDQHESDPLAGIGHLDEVRKQLENLVTTDTGIARRQMLAAFALEAAAADLGGDTPAAEQLVEWGCTQVRRGGVVTPPSAFNRLWQLASIALMEGALDPAGIQSHVNHAASQFPEEPRVLLARVFAVEQWSVFAQVIAGQPGRAVIRGPFPNGAAQAALTRERIEADALGRFKALLAEGRLTDPHDRAEAWLRAGHLQVNLHRSADALTSLGEVEPLTQSQTLVFLARLFRGQALEDLNKPDDARAAYLAALRIGPRAHSATMALAALEFGAGHRMEADQMVEGLIRSEDVRADPWWSYPTGDYRLIDDRLAAMRVALRELIQ